MKVKLYEIINASEVLTKIMKSTINLKAAYRIGKIAKKYQAEMEIFQDLRKKLFDKYGETQDDKSVKIKDDKIPEYQKEMNELLQNDVELDIEPVVISENEKIEISPAELLLVEKFITIEESNKE